MTDRGTAVVGSERDVPLARLERVLADRWDGAQGSRQGSRGRLNTLLLVDPSDPFLDERCDLLGSLRPGRLFVVRCGDPTTTAGVRWREVRYGDASSQLSEEVHFGSTEASQGLVAATIRSLVLPGAQSMVVVATEACPDDLLRAVLQYADLTVLDSRLIGGYFTARRWATFANEGVVDVAWIELSPWREQVRGAAAQLSREATVERVSYASTAVADGSRYPIQDFLFMGWVLDRLGLDPVSLSARGFECRGQSDRLVPCNIDIDRVGWSGPREASLAIRCTVDLESTADLKAGPGRIDAGKLVDEVSVRLTDAQDVHPYGVEAARAGGCDSSAAWRQWSHALVRYLLVGESIANYVAAVARAQSLIDLLSAFEHGGSDVGVS